ncbi:hypothetical protein TRIUR3_24196 [Triticum urartu]|uniref:Uncharacterized protein n=1 Tax=Triticum urartu TaxID=4572 RepID=M7Z6B2_TRIUA|nr:hypothetical protein TRIUR3_24196 [Triticum urartu]
MSASILLSLAAQPRSLSLSLRISLSLIRDMRTSAQLESSDPLHSCALTSKLTYLVLSQSVVTKSPGRSPSRGHGRRCIRGEVGLEANKEGMQPAAGGASVDEEDNAWMQFISDGAWYTNVHMDKDGSFLQFILDDAYRSAADGQER